ncbi:MULTISPECIES: staygreen family protein [Cytobacillus]|nr:staygreen family protein [Cytobacillus kochii]MCM3321420.1 staygreen family protein [Cytobacillus kochii]MCM3343746.1 staygreen family protein [Cytobacillus kochii]MDM5207580.1 staygreen family protein [Cytobacillus kochii]
MGYKSLASTTLANGHMMYRSNNLLMKGKDSMNQELDLTKLKVDILAPATNVKPVEYRNYYFRQPYGDEQAYLSISIENVKSNENTHSDALQAQWIPQMGQYVLFCRFQISKGEYTEPYAKIRYLIYEREINTWLTALVYGDQHFLQHYPWLLDSPIYVQFQSDYPAFNKIQYYGNVRQFLSKALQRQ